MSEPNFEFPALRDAQAKLDAARKRISAVFAEAGPDLNMDNVKSISGSREEKVEQIRKDNAELEDLQKDVKNYQELARAAANAPVSARETGDGAAPVAARSSKSLSQQVADSLGGLKSGRKMTLDVEVKTLFERTAGWDPEDVRSGRLELTPLRPEVHVFTHFPSGTIAQSDYKYMEETTHTASNVVEKAEGTTFGEAALALTERSKPVEKIPAWIPVTDEQLEDEPAARAYVENRLTGMIRRRLDSQLLTGTGVTPLLLGTEQVASIQTRAKGADTVLDALYKLFTTIRDDGFAEPSVVFIAPSKWQEVALLKTADGQYVWGHPSAAGPTTAWGVPVVQTTAGTSTVATTGDYANYSMLFIKRGIDVQITNSHASDFINGKQAIRADMRCVAVHFRPKAFGTVTGL